MNTKVADIRVDLWSAVDSNNAAFNMLSLLLL